MFKYIPIQHKYLCKNLANICLSSKCLKSLYFFVLQSFNHGFSWQTLKHWKCSVAPGFNYFNYHEYLHLILSTFSTNLTDSTTKTKTFSYCFTLQSFNHGSSVQILNILILNYLIYLNIIKYLNYLDYVNYISNTSYCLFRFYFLSSIQLVYSWKH